MKMNLTRWVVCTAALGLFSFPLAWAEAGTFANIKVQGAEPEPPGTEFDDWAGIPVISMDPADNEGDDNGRPLSDIKEVSIANNAEFLFVRIGYYTDSTINTYINFDTDSNPATGYRSNLFPDLEIGTEFGYVNDFPFGQFGPSPNIFNTNVSITGGPLGNGGALIWPFWNENGTQKQKELAIPLTAMITFPAGPAFPNTSFDLYVWNEDGLGDRTDKISYTLATAPAGVIGDYNNNMTVDAADYTVWRDNFGTSFTLPHRDPANTSNVSQADYTSWAMRFNQTGGASAAVVSAVPEPTSVLLVLLAVGSLGVYRRR